jgi:starch phosphorylase
MPEEHPNVAYFSMEIALEPDMPTYSGGLGVLAGDTLRSCADLGLRVCGITLLHRKGYFRQRIEHGGRQVELPDAWRPADHLEPLEPRVEVAIGGASVRVRAWRYRIVGVRGQTVDVLLLDTDLKENAAAQRALTDHLYGGDSAYRLEQEIVLGIAGVRMLRALGQDRITRFHLNEGHAALAILELVDDDLRRAGDSDAAGAVERVRDQCVFTTHTPVQAGHDRFSADRAKATLEPRLWQRLCDIGVESELNLTALALEGARFVNGVAMRHGEVSRGMFPGYPIQSITNGVHTATWASPAIAKLFDRRLSGWRRDPFALRYAVSIDPDEIAAAHAEAKCELFGTVQKLVDERLDPEALTLGFARRSTAYKRPMLALQDMDRLEHIAATIGPLQLVFAGKAHPKDHDGRTLIREIHRVASRRSKRVRVVFLPDYDMRLGAELVAGCDVWLNTPIPPLEASGTSGMKAALNGVPSLSILDGWWVEGCVEGVTGWAIGRDRDGGDLNDAERDRLHAALFYAKLEDSVAPTFYRAPGWFHSIMQHAIALNASYFNSHRMVLQYLFEAYRQRPEEAANAAPEVARIGPRS